MDYPVPENEPERLASLHDMGLQDSTGSPEFDAIANLAADVLECPIALISLLGEHEQWFKAKCGLDADVSPREVSFCNYTIMGQAPMIVNDARRDERFKNNPLVLGEPNVVFYAGAPISIDGVHNLGTLCVIDTQPREMTELQLKRLHGLARATEGLVDAYHSKKQAERAKLSEEKKGHELSRLASSLEQITKLSGVGGWEYEPSSKTLTWTEETKRIHEVSPDFEPKLDEAIDFYAPEARPVIAAAVEDAIETGSSWDLELPLVTALGKNIWVRAVGSPTYEGDTMISLVGAFQDISEHKRNETRIRASEAAARKRSKELRTVLDFMNEGVSVFDENANLVLWNQRYIEVFEKPRDEVHKGISLRRLLEHEKARGDFPGDIDEHLNELFEQLDRQVPVVHRFRTKQGKIINSTHAPLPRGGWVGTHSDVTAQVLAAERAQAVIRTVVDGIITIDERGSILEFNPASERLFGYSADEVLGKNITTLMGTDDAVKHDRYLERFSPVSKHNVIGKGRELTGVRKDGSTFVLELSVSITSDQGGRVFTGVLRDVTERKQMDMMKNQFVSNVNHELRTPLTTIRGALGLLKVKAEHLLDEKSKRLLELSYDGCDRLSSLVNDILDMEKIASGKMDYTLEVVEISDLVSDVVDRHVSYAELHKVTFDVQPAPQPIYCRVDPSRFNQALVNLLSNAAKFSPPGAEVKFVVDSETPDWVRIRVIDTGAGIPPEFVPKVFEKFAQADSSSTRLKGGSGLGLNITRDIIKAFGGTVDFDTALGVGTTFWMTLPMTNAPGQTERKAS